DGAFRRAGRFADVWMPYMYTPQRLADSLESVRAYAGEFGREAAEIRGAIFCWGAIDRDAAVARREAIAAVNATYRQDFEPLADRYLLTGTPQHIIKRLEEFRDAGAETVIFGGPRDATAWRRSAELFAAEVLPTLHGW
ncbi:LLM class flavin-dependent oxidoreductase, partial [uncultured Mycobacterium sp.]|uniref:LLM class flavin-dependent oxidoreductase n=1 Tax=uncultured Mycobacterium sp. TaxID=171292 RepID=UPI0035CC1C04